MLVGQRDAMIAYDQELTAAPLTVKQGLQRAGLLGRLVEGEFQLPVQRASLLGR